MVHLIIFKQRFLFALMQSLNHISYKKDYFLNGGWGGKETKEISPDLTLSLCIVHFLAVDCMSVVPFPPIHVLKPQFPAKWY